jgi:hypothetical protein
MRRNLLAGLMIVLAVVFAVISLGPLSNLWSDYKDSTTGTYLLLGLPFLALSIASAIAAIGVLRRR